MPKGIKNKKVDSESLNAGSIAESKPQESHPEMNIAIVLDGKREVRQYSLDSHGDNFTDLANQFAQKNKFQVKMARKANTIKCPHCHVRFERP